MLIISTCHETLANTCQRLLDAGEQIFQGTNSKRYSSPHIDEIKTMRRATVFTHRLPKGSHDFILCRRHRRHSSSLVISIHMLWCKWCTWDNSPMPVWKTVRSKCESKPTDDLISSRPIVYVCCHLPTHFVHFGKLNLHVNDGWYLKRIHKNFISSWSCCCLTSPDYGRCLWLSFVT